MKIKIFSTLISILVIVLFIAVSNVGAVTIGKTIIGAPTDSLKNGLVGHWTFDGKNMISNVADSSGSGNNGLMSGFTSTSSAVTPGRVGQGLRFDGVDDYVNIGNTSTLDFPDTSFSYSFWVYSNTVQARNVISNRATDSSASKGYSVYFANGATSARLEMRFIDGADNSYAISGAMKYGQWHHVTVVWNRESATVTAYTDGVQSLTPTSIVGVGSIPKSSTFKIGNGEKGYLKGMMDDVRIYNRVITQAEIKQLYNQNSSKISSTQSKPTGSALLSGLVGHWTMDGKDTNWATYKITDKSPSGNTATISGMSTSTSPKVGKVGQALTFDMVNDKLVISPSSSLNNMSSFTYSLWIRPHSNGQSELGYIFTKGSGGSGGYLIQMDNNRFDITINYDGGTNLAFVAPFDASTYNRWSHLVMTWDGTNVAANVGVYLNGVALSHSFNTNGVGSKVDDSSYSLTIGDNGSNTRYFDGEMDDFRVYNRVLSASEIQQLYSQGSTKVASTISRLAQTGLTSGLVGHWTFDGKNMISNVADSSGSGNNGLMSGFTSTSSAVTPGRVGQGLRFDGVDDKITTASEFLSTNPLTVTAWIKVSGLGGLSAGRIVDNGTFTVRLDSSNRIAVTNDSSLVAYSANNAFTFGTWVFVTAIRNSSNQCTIYINGQISSTADQNCGTVTAGSTNVIIGNRNSGGRTFNGVIDDIRIYNKVLTSSDILKIYNSGY